MTDPISNLKTCLGYAQAGTDETVRIYQDVATFEWVVSVGTKHTRVYNGPSLEDALKEAAQGEDPENG